MAKEEPPPNTSKGIPPAVYPIAGTLITAMAGILVVYVQMIIPKQIELHATQTAEMFHATQTIEMFHDNLTETALARVATATLTPTLSPEIDTPTPTTPLITPTFGASPTPTITLTPTVTPTPVGALYCINPITVWVRQGPGTDYDRIGALSYRDCLYFDARDPVSTWLRISPGQSDYKLLEGGWVKAEFIRSIYSPFDILPVIEPTPTPEPSPTLTPTPTPLG